MKYTVSLLFSCFFVCCLHSTEPKMDEQTCLFLDQLHSLNLPDLETLSVEQVRLDSKSFTTPSSTPVALIEEIKIPGPQGIICLRLYVPEKTESLPVFVSIHGGGWAFGSLDNNDPICREIAHQGHMIVVSIDYHLAPEHKYPAAIEDCYAALVWTVHNISRWGGDPSRLAIGGDSAGGNLAAAVSLMAREKHFPKIKAQVLMYPVTQHRFDTDSYQKYEKGYFLTKKQMEWFWSLYLSSPADGLQSHASPLYAEDLSELPPALIVLAHFDPLYDEGLAYGKKLQAAAVPVTISTYPTIHGFISKLDLGKTALKQIAQFLSKELKPDLLPMNIPSEKDS
jgi:acetyl esterase